MNEIMNFYGNYYIRYLQADEQTRADCRQHWLKCHKENVASGRDDLTSFSAQILARIALADEYLRTHIEKA